MKCNFFNMDTKKLKINIPEGYEIDRENSTFEEIVFKKVEDSLTELPKTWEEYKSCSRDDTSYFFCNPLKSIKASLFSGVYNEFSTEERVKQYVALGRLIQLRDYWVGDWKNDSNNFVNVIYNLNGEIKNMGLSHKQSLNFPLTFPTIEMAQKFIKCFNNLINEASPLI